MSIFCLGKHWTFRAAFPCHLYPLTLISHTFSSLRQVKAFHRNLVQTVKHLSNQWAGFQDLDQSLPAQDTCRKACANLNFTLPQFSLSGHLERRNLL